MCDVILLHKFMWSHRVWRRVFQKLAAECQSAGYSGTLIPYKCDLSNEEEILSMFSAIKTLHKGVDVCINNAGLAHNEPLLSGKTEGWRNMIDVGGSHTQTNTKVFAQSRKWRKSRTGLEKEFWVAIFGHSEWGGGRVCVV